MAVDRVVPARPDAIRRHNLSLVLQQIHLEGTLTRAELTQRLQVSRSTVGALVGDLIALELVEEVVPNRGSGVGRPSHVIGPRSPGPYVIAVDVDVTQVVTAAVGLGGAVLARAVVEIDESSCDAATVTRIIAESTAAFSKGIGRPGPPVALAVGIPGTVDRLTGRVGVAPNLGWSDEQFGARIRAAIPGVQIHVGNDADLAVFAEHRRGSARGCSDVVFIMGRYGVGAGFILGGQPVGGYDGHAGEIGHNVVDATGPTCHCGKSGCVETYIGEPALLGMAGRSGPATAEAMAELFGAARAGEPAALGAIRGVADPLGRTIASLVNTLNPQRVLLGGFLTDLFDIAGPDIEVALARYALETPSQSVQLTQPAFGADATLVGAAELAFADLLADPLRVADGRAPAAVMRT